MGVLAHTRATIQHLLRAVGYQIVSYPYTLPGRRIDLLRAREVRLLVDVGANNGSWAHGVRRAGYRGDIFSIEPLPEPFARLQARSRRDPGWKCEQLALGSNTGAVTMNVSRGSGWSSPLPLLDLTRRAAPQAQYVSNVTVPMSTLDEIIQREGALETPLAIKIDVQGYEDAVLAGAEACLERTELLEVELSLVPLYGGQRLWRENFDLIQGFGLEPAWIESCWFLDPDSRRALQLNVLFSRNGSRTA